MSKEIPLSERLDRVEKKLMETEKKLMEGNVILGDILEERYAGNRMGFEKDGSVTRDGKVVWPERLVQDDATDTTDLP